MGGNAIRGCQEGKVTPKYYEVKCPKCGEAVEVFVFMGGSADKTGRTTADERCPECGRKIPALTPITALELY
jgi:rRNA maturation protein Nop10